MKIDLIDAIEDNNVTLLKELIAKGNDIDKKYNYFNNYNEIVTMTPLVYAIDHGSFEIIELLIEAGADVNKSVHTRIEKSPEYRFIETTPLVQAVANNRLEIVKLLLENGAKDSPSRYIYSAAETAKNFHHDDILDLLEQFKAVNNPKTIQQKFYTASYEGNNSVVFDLYNNNKFTVNEIASGYWLAREGHHYELAKELLRFFNVSLASDPNSEMKGQINLKGSSFLSMTNLSANTIIKLENHANIDTGKKVNLSAISIACFDSNIISSESIYLNTEFLNTSNCLIKAPDIYLPFPEHIQANNTQFIGTIHHLTNEQFDNLS